MLVSFAPEPAYARGYRLSMRGGGAKAGRVGRAPNLTNAVLLSPACDTPDRSGFALAKDEARERGRGRHRPLQPPGVSGRALTRSPGSSRSSEGRGAGRLPTRPL